VLAFELALKATENEPRDSKKATRETFHYGQNLILKLYTSAFQPPVRRCSASRIILVVVLYPRRYVVKKQPQI